MNSFIKEYWVLLIFASAFPIIISQIIRIPLGNWTIGKEDSWVSFFGSYLGGIIGGIITLFVFKKTIEKQAEMQSTLRTEQEEIRNLSMKPYLAARLARKSDINEYSYKIDCLQIVEDSSLCDSLTAAIRLENVGMGNAIGIEFFPEDDGFYINLDLDPLALKVGTAMVIALTIKSLPDKEEFTLRVRLTDLLENVYNQKIKLAKIQNQISVISISKPVPKKSLE